MRTRVGWLNVVSQIQISRDLGGNGRNANSRIQESKMSVFGEMSDMLVDTEHIRIRSNLFVSNNLRIIPNSVTIPLEGKISYNSVSFLLILYCQ